MIWGNALIITFKTRRLEKSFNSAKQLKKRFGDRMCKVIQMRLAVLQNASNLSLVPRTRPDRCHMLKADRQEQFAVDLVNSYRLIFEPNHNPTPRTDDGGIDLSRVTDIVILDVLDYH